MTPASFGALLMLLSAVTHAVIGALMKRSDDKLIFRAILGGICCLAALPFTFILPLPTPQMWAILAISVALHWAYQLAQAAALTRGDMSVVYPIMRGAAPALAAFFAFLFLKEALEPLEIIGLLLSVLAIIGFGLPGKIRRVGWAQTLGFALTCGVLTALYTVVDAKGMRIAPIKASFVAWIFVIDGLGMPVVTTWLHRRKVIEKARTDIQGGAIGAGLTLISYSAALYALSLAPVAKLAAIRETSVVFGAILAAVWLKEDFGARRIALAAVLAFGLILMQTA